MAFFQESTPSRAPFLNAPASVLILIGVIVASHLARIASGANAETLLVEYAFIPARYVAGFPTTLGSQILTFFSYVFLHAGYTHLIINALWLLAFGPEVARRLGTLKFLLFFFFCGAAAAALHLAFNWGSVNPVVGCSGAVSGLMGAAIRILYGRRGFIFGDGHALAPLFSRPIVTFSLMWVLVAVVTGIFGVGVTGDALFVAWIAHLGGYFAGLAAIGPFDAMPLTKRSAA